MAGKVFIVRSKYILRLNNSFEAKELLSQDSHNISDRKYTNRDPDVYFLDDENLKVRIRKDEIAGIVEVRPVKKEVEINKDEE